MFLQLCFVRIHTPSQMDLKDRCLCAGCCKGTELHHMCTNHNVYCHLPTPSLHTEFSDTVIHLGIQHSQPIQNRPHSKTVSISWTIWLLKCREWGWRYEFEGEFLHRINGWKIWQNSFPFLWRRQSTLCRKLMMESLNYCISETNTKICTFERSDLWLNLIILLNFLPLSWLWPESLNICRRHEEEKPK